MQEQVVYTSTIYDMCKQQDCLTPLCNCSLDNNYLISPAKNGTAFIVNITNTSSSTTFPIAPDTVYYLSSEYKHVKIVENSLDTVLSVISFSESLTQPGYYNLKIKYRFNYALEFQDANYDTIPVSIQNKTVNQVQAYSTYIKTVQLFGGCIKNKVTTLSSTSGQCCSKNPEYNIQATANILSTELTPLGSLLCNPDVDQSKASLDPNGMSVVSVTFGLFTIISLFRPTRVNVLTGKPIDIPTCDNPIEPCEDFNSIPFPYESFNFTCERHCK